MKFSKMLLITAIVAIVGLTLLQAIYWFLLYTKAGNYLIGVIFVGMWYGIVKVITYDTPEEKIW